MKIGLFGGSFDPVHCGHLMIARAAMRERKYEKFFWIPAACSPFKALHKAETSAEHRAQMIRLAIAEDSGMSLSDYEWTKSGVSYSVETMRHFQTRYPGAQIEWLLGADALATLETWHESEVLAQGMTFVAAPRPGFPVQFPTGFRVHWLSTAEKPISSSRLRESLLAGELSPDIPDAVMRYIREQGLYRKEKK